MNAHEAMELTKGSIQRKGWLFKMKLAWLCGKLNHTIENEAELGQGRAELDDINQRTARLYFPLMAQFYEADDYYVCYQDQYSYYNEFVVIWDESKIPSTFKKNYTYRTKEKNHESNRSSSWNW